MTRSSSISDCPSFSFPVTRPVRPLPRRKARVKATRPLRSHSPCRPPRKVPRLTYRMPEAAPAKTTQYRDPSAVFSDTSDSSPGSAAGLCDGDDEYSDDEDCEDTAGALSRVESELDRSSPRESSPLSEDGDEVDDGLYTRPSSSPDYKASRDDHDRRDRKRRRFERAGSEDTDTENAIDSSLYAVSKSPEAFRDEKRKSLDRPLGPSASIRALSKGMKQLAAGSDVIMYTDTEVEDEASSGTGERRTLVARALVAYTHRDLLAKRRACDTARSTDKAPVWTRLSAADPNKTLWQYIYAAINRVRGRSRRDEFEVRLPGQRSHRYLRKAGVPASDTRRTPPRPNPTACLGQIHVHLILERITRLRYRQRLLNTASAVSQMYMAPRGGFVYVGPWWPLRTEEEDAAAVEAIETGLLPPAELHGHVDDEASELFFTRGALPVEPVHEAEEAQPRSRKRRAGSEDEELEAAWQLRQRTRLHQIEASRSSPSRTNNVTIPIIPLTTRPPTPFAGQGRRVGNHYTAPEDAESAVSEDLDATHSDTMTNRSRSESISSVATSTDSSRASEPPQYDEIEPPIPIALPIPATRRPVRRSPPAQPPAYQRPLPLRGAAYSSERTPSPPPPFNAMTDCTTLIAPMFIEDDEEDEELLARITPSGQLAPREVSVGASHDASTSRTIVGSFPRAALMDASDSEGYGDAPWAAAAYIEHGNDEYDEEGIAEALVDLDEVEERREWSWRSWLGTLWG